MKTYIVSFKEIALVEEAVEARSRSEAIRLIRQGEGERRSFEIDDARGPFAFRAEEEA